MVNVTLKHLATWVVVSRGPADLQSLQEGEPMSENALQFMKVWVAKQSRANKKIPDGRLQPPQDIYRTRHLTMDLRGSFLKLKEKKYIRVAEKKETLQSWCHLWDVAHHNHIAFDPANEDTMQLLFERTGGLPSRPSEIPKWGAKEHKQYYFAATQLEYLTITKAKQ